MGDIIFATRQKIYQPICSALASCASLSPRPTWESGNETGLLVVSVSSPPFSQVTSVSLAFSWEPQTWPPPSRAPPTTWALKCSNMTATTPSRTFG